MGLAQLILPGLDRLDVRDQGCNLRWPTLDMTLTCRRDGDLEAGRCLALLLRPGGRTVSVCRLLHQGKTHALAPLASLRLTRGAEALRHLAGRFASSNIQGKGSFVDDLMNFQIFGRSIRSGNLLAFSVVLSHRVAGTMSWPRWRGLLSPAFEIDSAVESGDLFKGESLFVIN